MISQCGGRSLLALVAAAALAASPVAWAQNVKVTPLGSLSGELCDRDRATIFEDPTGVRILYDAGQSVTGSTDPRLGVVHVVLLSHAHGDHIGDRKLSAQNAGIDLVKDRPVYLARSGRTMEFDASGKCVAGC